MKFTAILCIFLTLAMIFIPLIPIKQDNTVMTSTVQSEKPKQNKTVPDKIKVYFTKKDKTEKIDLNEYITGVVCAEISPNYEENAIMAQAIASRTYAIYMLENGGYDKADISDDYSIHQGYLSKEDLKEKWKDNFDTYYKKIEDAVLKVQNKAITYNGEIIKPAFFALCGGKTENAKDIWGGDVPYLKSVSSVGDELCSSLSSTVTYSIDEFKKLCGKLQKCNLSSDETKWVGEIKKTASGAVKEITIGENEYSAYTVQKVFSIKSNNFNLKYDNQKFIFSVIGNGHGVGMSQYGADYMARQGSSYEEILKHYYTDVEIADYI